jgi:hypothetical protein
MTDFSTLFQAVAIEARCRLRWAGVNDETRRIWTKAKSITIPYLEPYTAKFFVDMASFELGDPYFKGEVIKLETLWIGNHQYMRIGYGPHINSLAVQDKVF